MGPGHRVGKNVSTCPQQSNEDRLDRCTSGVEIDKMLADILDSILFIYALMGVTGGLSNNTPD